MAEVEESYLLPADWIKPFVAATEYFRGHQPEFQDPPTDDGRKSLLDQVAGDNPVLAVAAARILAKSSDGSLLRAISRLNGANAQALRVAALMNIALSAAPDVPPREAAELLGRLVDPPCSAEQLRGAALGMLAARSGGGPTITRLVLLGVSGLDSINHLIIADRIESTMWMFIRERQAALDDMHDPYLDDIFSRIGHDCIER